MLFFARIRQVSTKISIFDFYVAEEILRSFISDAKENGWVTMICRPELLKL